MKTFKTDIIGTLKGFGLPADDPASFANKHWVAIDDNPEKRIIYLFSAPDRQLIYGEHGNTIHGTWEHILPNELMICRPFGNELFTIAFADETVLALKEKGQDFYGLFVEVEKFDGFLDSPEDVTLYLKKKYGTAGSGENRRKVHSEIEIPVNANPDEFFPEEYPALLKDISTIQKELSRVPRDAAAEILLSYCKNHSAPAKYVHHNPEWTEMILDGRVPIGMLEKLFAARKDKPAFLQALESFVTGELQKHPAGLKAYPGFEMKGENKEVIADSISAYKVQVLFADGVEARLWKTCEGAQFYYFDPKLEDYIRFETEDECLETVYNLEKKSDH